MRRLPWLAVGAAPVLYVACNGLLGLDPPEREAVALLDAGAEGETGIPSCRVAAWPAPPQKETVPVSDGGDITFTVAMRQFGLNEPLPEAGPLGVDMDRSCTCPDPPSCGHRGDAAPPICDEPGGRDVSFNRNVIAQLAKGSDSFKDPALNDGLTRGEFGVLFRVEGYNGASNDNQVTVSMYVAMGLRDGGVPAWDGGDAWDLDPASLQAGGQDSQYYDPTAYVTNGVLVAAALRQTRLRLGSGTYPLELELEQTILMARLRKLGAGSYALEDGTIAARWPTTNMLRTLAAMRAPGPQNVPLCAVPEVFGFVRQVICGAADISTNPGRDNTGVSCDAVSLAMSFRAVPARMGGRRTRVFGDAGCDAVPLCD